MTVVDPVYFGGLFDGMNLHTDVLLKNSTYSQNVASLSAKSVEVKGDLTVAESLNGVNYGKLVELSTGSGSLNVKILGQTNFLTQPVFKTINDIDIDELYEHAWLSHRNAVLKATYSLDYAEFSHNIISTVSYLFDNKHRIFVYHAQNYTIFTQISDLEIMAIHFYCFFSAGIG